MAHWRSPALVSGNVAARQQHTAPVLDSSCRGDRSGSLSPVQPETALFPFSTASGQRVALGTAPCQVCFHREPLEDGTQPLATHALRVVISPEVCQPAARNKHRLVRGCRCDSLILA